MVKNLDRLLSPLVEPRGFVVAQSSNIRFALANSMPAPEVFVVSAAIWSRECLEDDYVSIAPLVLVEVLSPANRKIPVSRKVQLYLDNGVRLVPEVRPKSKTVVTHAPGEPSLLFGEGDKIELPAEMDGAVAVSAIFAI